MTILLHDPGQFHEFEAALNADLLRRAVASLDPHTVDLTVPRLEFASPLHLTETLKAMRMSDAFAPSRAGFSRIDGRSCSAGDARCVYTEEVVHHAFVSVD